MAEHLRGEPLNYAHYFILPGYSCRNPEFSVCAEERGTAVNRLICSSASPKLISSPRGRPDAFRQACPQAASCLSRPLLAATSRIILLSTTKSTCTRSISSP